MTQFIDIHTQLNNAHTHQSQLQQQLDLLKAELAEKKLQHKELKVTLATGGNTVKLQNELDELNFNVDDQKSKQLSLQQKLSTEHSALDTLHTELTAIEQKKQLLLSSSNLQELEQQLQHNLTVLDQTHTQEQHNQSLTVTRLQEQCTVIQSGVAELQKQLNELIAQRNAAQKSLDKKIQHIAQLKGLTSNSTSIMSQLSNTIQQKQTEIDTLTQQIQQCENKMTECNNALAELDLRFKEEQKRRKEFQFKYEDIKGKVRVYARIRPMSSMEISNKETCLLRCGKNVWTLELNETERDVMGNITDKYREYVFDHIFQPGLIQADGSYSKSNAAQIEVFNECKDFAELTLNGINTCIFAYGQSGTGKTFTMAGVKSVENPSDTTLLGLKPRMIDYIWQLVEQNKHTHTYTIQCYLVEIYLNKLEDVFWKYDNKESVKSPKKSTGAVEPPELKIRVDAKKRVEIENVLIKQFTDYDTMNTYVDTAEVLRRTRKTGLNESSSRSHLVFTILISSTEIKTGKTMKGKLSLVDLAGSERADKTNVDGLSKQQRDAMLEEGIAINESLRMLKNVFRILGSATAPTKEPSSPKSPKKAAEEVVQYRGNILTELMQDSLGGNAKTLMFVNVGPAASNISETQDSLQYGDYVKNITNEKVEAAVDYTEQIRVLNEKLNKYKAKYGE